MAADFIHTLSNADKERFWAKVQIIGPNECWNWLAAKDGRGYGKFRKGPKYLIASRLSLAMHVGRDLHTSEMACHTCDNPACTNPSHLFIGTGKQNFDDAVQKGRISKDMSDRLAGAAKEKKNRSHCKRGHELSGRNLNVRADGRRRCLACARLKPPVG